MSTCKPASTQVDFKSKLSQLAGSLYPDPTEYYHLVGVLQYLTFTRPDILIYVDQQVCLFMHAPRTPPHMVALKRIIHFGLRLYSSSAHTLLSC